MARRAAILLCCLQILTILVEESYSANSQFVVVQVDKEARLECDATHYGEWWHFPVGQDIYRTVSRDGFVNSEYTSRFSVTDDNSLKIKNVQAEDAGEYCCYHDLNGRRTCLVLTVIEKVLCSNNATEDGAVTGADCLGDHPSDVVQHQCHTVYHGTTPPVITWIDVGASQQVRSCFEVRDNVAKCILTQTATGVAHQHSVQCNISSQMCSSSFKQQFAYNATSVVTITQGSIICIANASGPCSYEWTMVGNETFSKHGQVLDISGEDTLHPGSYVCFATCPIRSVACVVEAMKVDYQPTSQNFRTNLHDGAYNKFNYAGLAGISGMIFVIGILVYCRRHYIKRRFKKILFAQFKHDIQKNAFETNDDEHDDEHGHLLNDFGNNALESTQLKIRGIAILGEYIYIVGHASRQIESYNKNTLLKERDIEVKMLDSAWGMATCAKYNCLYVSEHVNRSAALIHRVELNDNEASFFTVSERFFGARVNISITRRHTVLLSGGKCSSPAVMEYDHHGIRIREIICCYPIDVHKAVLLRGNFVLLAQGWPSDVYSQVYKLNAEDGQIISSYNGGGSGMGIPFDVVVNDEETLVFVASVDDKCVVMLNSGLEIQENRQIHKIKCKIPFRLAFDTEKQVLYVADWNGGVKIVNISCEDNNDDIFSVDLYDNGMDEYQHIALENFNESGPVVIRGMAILRNTLYIVATDTRTIKAFCLNSKMIKTSVINVKQLNSAYGMAACEHFNCLYLSEYYNTTVRVGSELKTEKGLVIHKVKFESDGTYEASQFPISQDYQGSCVNVSVTGAHTLLVMGFILSKLEEYDTNGRLVREIILDPTLSHLQKIAWLDDTTILVSHGHLDDKLRRICDVNSVSGEIRKSYVLDGGYTTDLVVTGDKKLLFMPVVEQNCILVLSSKLELIKTIPVDATGFSFPLRLAIDEINKQLYVGSYIKSAYIMIVDITELLD